MWRSRIRLRRTSVFSYLTGSLLCFWCCVFLVFFSFSLPLSWPPSAVKRRNQPVRDAKKRGKALALSFVLSALHFWSVSQSVCRCSVARQFVILANHERSTAKKEREKESEPGWFRYRCQSCFRFFRSLSLSLSLSLYLSLYILVVWVIFFFSFDCRCLLAFQLLRHF